MASRKRKPEQRRFRIRPCDGSKNCWCLVALKADGSESQSYGSYTTAYSLDALLKRAGHLTPRPGDHVEFVSMVSDARRAA